MISRVQMASGLFDNVADLTLTMPGSVTAGNRIVFAFSNICDGYSAEVFASDLTKSAGTATIGTVVEDGQNSDGNVMYASVFSAPITGSGTLSMKLDFYGASGNYAFAALIEYSGIDTDNHYVDNQGWTTTSATPFTNSLTSASNGGLFIGVLGLLDYAVITISEDAPYSLLYEWEDGVDHHFGSIIEQIVTSETTDAATWVLSTACPFTTQLVIYRPASSTPSLPGLPEGPPATSLEEQVTAVEEQAAALSDDLTTQVALLVEQVNLLTRRVDALGSKANTITGSHFGNAKLAAEAGTTATAQLTTTSATATLAAASGMLAIGPSDIDGSAALGSTTDLAASADLEAP